MTSEIKTRDDLSSFEPIHSESDLNRFKKLLVNDYFRYGSVDDVLRVRNYRISWAAYHRVLNEWGVIKHVEGRPRVGLSQILMFFETLLEKRIPLETLHSQMSSSFDVSRSTLHRIRRNIEARVVRSAGTILIVTPQENPELVLVAHDKSTPRPEVGKLSDSLSLPMGYSRLREPHQRAIGRVLQHEVFTQLVVDEGATFLESLDCPDPFKSVIVTDIRVRAFHIKLPKVRPEFFSYKLQDHHFVPVGWLLGLDPARDNVRPGVIEATQAYKQVVLGGSWEESVDSLSLLNLGLLNLRGAHSNY